MEKKAFVKSTELVGCELEGIVEVVIAGASAERCNVEAPDGTFYDVPWSEVYDNKNLQGLFRKDNLRIRYSGYYFYFGRKIDLAFIYEGNVVAGKMTLDYWSRDEESCQFSVEGVNKVFKMSELGLLYRGKDEATRAEGITVHKQDGTKEVVGGEFKKYKLTDEQKGMVEKLKASLKECKDAGIFLIFDTDDCTLYGVNNSDDDLEDDETYGEGVKDRVVPRALYEDIADMCTCGSDWGLVKKA